jgi:hypothetical protein
MNQTGTKNAIFSFEQDGHSQFIKSNTTWEELKECLTSLENPENWLVSTNDFFIPKNSAKRLKYSVKATLFFKAMNGENWKPERTMKENMTVYIALSCLGGSSREKKNKQKP